MKKIRGITNFIREKTLEHYQKFFSKIGKKEIEGYEFMFFFS